MTRRPRTSIANRFGEENPGVFLSLEDVAQRRGDIGRGECAGGHLVEQWLEEVEVLAIEERDLHGHMPEAFGRTEAAETAANDYDSMGIRHVSTLDSGLPS